MANDLLGVSVSGLKVSQAALRTVGHNIANANTEGYSRQRIEPVTNPATLYQGNWVGNGANVNNIGRVVNDFVIGQLRTDTTLFGDLNGFYNQITQLDNLLSDESTGIASSLNSFFNAVQNGADDPTSLAARQLVVSEAENLSDRFNTVYGRMQAIESGTQSGMKAAVSQVNALVGNLARLNERIADTWSNSQNSQPNDLLDQRDQTLKALAALIPIQVSNQGGGQINVSVGNGQTLVIGADARSLSLEPRSSEPGKMDVLVHNGTRKEVITRSITGGELGGLLRFSDEVMTDTYNKIGRIAIGMADAFNQAHAQGVDLDSEFGRLFFNDINDTDIARDRVIGNAANSSTGNRSLALYINDVQQLTDSDYELSIVDGGLYRVTRLNDNVDVASGLMPGRIPFSISFDGMALELESGPFQGGDRFTLQPTRSGAQDMRAVIAEGEALAFASPLVTGADSGNRGSGRISAGEVLALRDADGNPLPPFNQSGAMNPPMVVVFRTPYSYDVLDNSDPANPVDLDPPVRDQRYTPGMDNPLFNSTAGQAQIVSRGPMMGLPNGSLPVTQASLQPGGTLPAFTVSDFSGPGAGFAFDLTVSNTLNGANDGTVTITVNGAALVDNDSLLSHINAQLNSTAARAYIADDGALAFRLQAGGYGDISLDNYDDDPDNTGAADPGQVAGLLGFDIATLTYTTEGNADGVSGAGRPGNGYPSEAITITRPSDVPGQVQTTNLFTDQNASARQIASQLGNIPGVTANASTFAAITGLNATHASPLQISLNGQALLPYQPDPVTGVAQLGGDVPDPNADPAAFYDYLAARINDDPALQAAGIHATAGVNDLTGEAELHVQSTEGDDLQLSFTGASGDQMAVHDGINSPVQMTAAGNGVTSQVVVGGQLDIYLDEGVTLRNIPPDSMLLGDTEAADFSTPTLWGIQAAISGTPAAGDRFTLDFNADAAMDNRNALNLVALQEAGVLASGSATFNQAYGALVEKIGITSNSAKLNRDAAEQVLVQSQSLRDSISGVNLDEEAADLIRFEQLFSANARVISVARDLFDRLLNAF